mmetsp:Transcript_11940/g.26183  ORF Transcript_11940/g.26183 Transcript_11940/m.26183 type:complete len:320 (-) Transcript_11940:2183-3142(-)
MKKLQQLVPRSGLLGRFIRSFTDEARKSQRQSPPRMHFARCRPMDRRYRDVSPADFPHHHRLEPHAAALSGVVVRFGPVDGMFVEEGPGLPVESVAEPGHHAADRLVLLAHGVVRRQQVGRVPPGLAAVAPPGPDGDEVQALLHVLHVVFLELDPPVGPFVRHVGSIERFEHYSLAAGPQGGHQGLLHGRASSFPGGSGESFGAVRLLCGLRGVGHRDHHGRGDLHAAFLAVGKRPRETDQAFGERSVHQGLAVDLHDVEDEKSHRHAGPSGAGRLPPGPGAELLKAQKSVGVVRLRPLDADDLRVHDDGGDGLVVQGG